MIPLRALIVVLAAVLVVPVALADGDAWEDGARHLDLEQNGDSFEMHSDHAGAQDDRIRFRFDGGNVEFRLEFSDALNEIQTDAELRVRLDRVLEFEDENGDRAFQASERVRAEHQPSDLEFQILTIANVSAAGVDGIQASATYSFKDAPAASLTFRATAFGNLTTFEGLVQRPVEVKMDILLENLDTFYTRSDTLPAISLQVETVSPDDVNLTAGQATFTAGNLSAVFSWKDTAEVDGAERAVGITAVPRDIDPGEAETLVTFAYARGSNITHDPTVGFALRDVIRAAGGVLGNIVFYAVGAVAAVAVFGLLAGARKARKVKGK